MFSSGSLLIGQKKRCKKRGFKTAHEAKKHEYAKSLKVESSMNMFLKDFVEKIVLDGKNQLERFRELLSETVVRMVGKVRDELKR